MRPDDRQGACLAGTASRRAASLFGTTLGKLAAKLKASRYQPEHVDEIYSTQMYPDHVASLMAGGQAVFPNDVVRADQADADCWLSQADPGKVPINARALFQGAMASLNPYVAADKFKPIKGTPGWCPASARSPPTDTRLDTSSTRSSARAKD